MTGNLRAIVAPEFQSVLQSVLVLNGDIPPETTLAPWRRLPLVAADGAGHRLAQKGISPDFVVGDLDSLKPEFLSPHTQVFKDPCQETTDFEKCLAFLSKKGWLPTLILGLNGGRLDHVLNNLSVLLKTETGAHLVYDPPFWAQRLESGKRYTFQNVPPKTPFSIMGIEPSRVTASGLAWSFKDLSLSLLGKSGACNWSFDPTVTFQVEDGRAILFWHEAAGFPTVA